MRRRERTPRLLRAVHHAVLHESRHGRAAEIAGWANAVAALGFGAAAWVRWGGLGAPLGVSAGIFVLLRLSMAHRATIVLAGLVATVAVGAAGGGLAWTLGHVLDGHAAPAIAGVLGALASALAPAWAFASVARHRLDDVPDSLVEPVSVPPSGDDGRGWSG